MTLRSIADRQGPIFKFAYRAITSGVPYTFGSYLKSAIDDSPLDQKTIAAKIGMSPQHLTDLVKGRRTPPPEKMDALADALGLVGSARQRFEELAMAMHLPPRFRARMYAVLRRLDSLEQRLAPPGE